MNRIKGRVALITGDAVAYLASEDGRYVTGTAQVIDAWAMNPFKDPHRVDHS